MSIFVAILLCFYAPSLESREINVDVEKYCKMQCPIPGTVHTICEFKCEIAPDCQNFQEYELNEEERASIVQHHNEFRNRLASGNDTRGGNSNAKDMLELQYDPEIEVAVSCWGRRCMFAHDKCRQTLSYDTAGQNLFIQSSSLPIDAKDKSYLYDCVKSWYEEIVSVKPQYTRRFTIPSKGQIGHFTQVVWSTTAFVGCTRVSWTSQVGLKYKLHIICNYSPAGNIFGASVYTRGVGCSKEFARSTRYSSLCVRKGQKPLLMNTTTSSIAGPLESSTVSEGNTTGLAISGNATSSEAEVIPSKLPKTSTTSLLFSQRPETTKAIKGTKATKATKSTKATNATKATKATKTTTKTKVTTTTTKTTTKTTAIATTTTPPTTTTTTTTTASPPITPMFVFTVKPQKPPPLSAIITTYHPTFPRKVQPPSPQPSTPSPTSPTTQPPPPPENDTGAEEPTSHKNAERKLITVSPVTKLKTRTTGGVKYNMRNSNVSILLINLFICIRKIDVI